MVSHREFSTFISELEAAPLSPTPPAEGGSLLNPVNSQISRSMQSDVTDYSITDVILV